MLLKEHISLIKKKQPVLLILISHVPGMKNKLNHDKKKQQKTVEQNTQTRDGALANTLL